jgi:hypothetical protein
MDNDLSISINFNELFADLKASQANFSETAESEKAKRYDSLLEKYVQAIKIIEQLKMRIDEVGKDKLPTKDEVESIGAMLDLVNKLDIKTLDKLNQLGGKGSMSNES